MDWVTWVGGIDSGKEKRKQDEVKTASGSYIHR